MKLLFIALTLALIYSTGGVAADLSFKEIIPSYVSIQEALAKDDLDGAKTAVQALTHDFDGKYKDRKSEESKKTKVLSYDPWQSEINRERA